jgi:hypothetical protein
MPSYAVPCKSTSAVREPRAVQPAAKSDGPDRRCVVVAESPPNLRRRVWLYREPWRSAFTLALLGLLAVNVVGLARGVPDRYPHEHGMLVLLPLVLVLGHLSAAYVPTRWQRWSASVALAFALGVMLAQLLG